MRCSASGVALVKKYEGYSCRAYRCPAGVLTIGYGHTGTDVTASMEITQDKADALLRSDLAHAEAAVNRENLRINQNQFNALVSFTFNVGAKNFGNSTLLKIIKNDPLDPQIVNQFRRWDKVRGEVIAGLVLRREDEIKHYFNTI